MKLGYTEFSFGYAFTENLIRSASSRTAGAPYFPNLIQEARLGYDVRIDLPGCPLYFQYKLPELMIRDSASEISKYSLPGIRTPFFRMYLMRRNFSRQHERLICLEKRSPNTVYYAAPVVQNVHAFNAAYNDAMVHRRSVFFSPKHIGELPDDKQHTLAFRQGLTKAWLCSEPREVPVFQFEGVSEQLRDLFKTQRYSTLETAVGHSLEDMRSLATAQDAEVYQSAVALLENRYSDWPPWYQFEGLIRQRIRERTTMRFSPMDIEKPTTQVVEDLLVSREIARVMFGLDLVIAQASFH